MPMPIKGDRLRDGLMWSLPALLCANVVFADDAKKIAEAQVACVKLAKAHLGAASQQSLDFGETANVSSDPADNVFLFRWEKAICKGSADDRKITHLFVGDKSLACNTPSDDPRLTASCALSY